MHSKVDKVLCVISKIRYSRNLVGLRYIYSSRGTVAE